MGSHYTITALVVVYITLITVTIITGLVVVYIKLITVTVSVWDRITQLQDW